MHHAHVPEHRRAPTPRQAGRRDPERHRIAPTLPHFHNHGYGGQLPRPIIGNLKTCGAVRGGGRLFHNSPVDGYSQAEMIAAARQQKMYNTQRSRLAAMLATSQRAGLVTDANLNLALSMAKGNADLQSFKAASTPETVRPPSVRYGVRPPPRVAWKAFMNDTCYKQAMAPPEMAPPSSPRHGFQSPRPRFTRVV